MTSDPFAPTVDADLARLYGKTSGELATLLELFDRQVRAGDFRSLEFGVPDVDAMINTMWPGTLTMVMARPSHRKSSTLKWLARLACTRLMAEHPGGPLASGRVVVYVSLEESVHEATLAITGAPFGVADLVAKRVESRAVMRHSDEVARWPLFVIDPELTDLARDRIRDKTQPRLTAEQVYREIEQAETDGHGKPAAVFVDYVQRAATEGREGSDREKATRVANAVGRFAEMAQRLGVPIVLAAQAGRQVDTRTIPAPDIGDGQWSSQLEQDAHTVIALWYPIKSGLETRQGLRARMSEGLGFANASLTYDELMAPDTLTVWLRKQRHGLPGGQWAVKCDPATGALSEWPKHYVRIP